MSTLNEHDRISTDQIGSASAVATDGPSAPRKLRLKARAERMGETRQRIARATYELHASVGPARTTVSAIAERAGVQRLTVYKHFPHDRDIFQACTTYHWELDPAPDPTLWREIIDPEQRLRHALAELYAYFRRNEKLYANVARDMAQVLEQMEGPPPQGIQRLMELPSKWQTALADGWAGEQMQLRNAALALAIDFSAWRTLATGQGLSDEQIIDLMTSLVIRSAQQS